jgi:hypothetical protein
LNCRFSLGFVDLPVMEKTPAEAAIHDNYLKSYINIVVVRNLEKNSNRISNLKQSL